MYKLSSLKQQPKHKDIGLIMMYSQPQMKNYLLIKKKSSLHSTTFGKETTLHQQRLEESRNKKI